MWLLLRRQERPVSGGFIFITRWNSLGHVRRVMNSMASIHEVFCIHRIRSVCIGLLQVMFVTTFQQIAMLIITWFYHSRPQRPCSFWSAPRDTTFGRFQHRKSAIHGLPITLRILKVKSDKSDWFWYHPIVIAKPIRTEFSLDLPRGRDSWC